MAKPTPPCELSVLSEELGLLQTANPAFENDAEGRNRTFRVRS